MNDMKQSESKLIRSGNVNMDSPVTSGWGKVRLARTSSGLLFLILIFLSMDQTTLVTGFPTEDEFSRAVAKAAVAAVMNSDKVGSHHRYPATSESMNPNKEIGELKVEPGGDMRMESSSSLPRRLEAVELLFQKVAANAAKAAAEREMEVREEETEQTNVGESRTGNERARALWSTSNDFSMKASKICRTSAGLLCGKRILAMAEDHGKDLSVHMKCDLRDDFLRCINREKDDCLVLAATSILPELPPKETITMEQTKLWDVLWTSGGCILST